MWKWAMSFNASVLNVHEIRKYIFRHSTNVYISLSPSVSGNIMSTTDILLLLNTRFTAYKISDIFTQKWKQRQQCKNKSQKTTKNMFDINVPLLDVASRSVKRTTSREKNTSLTSKATSLRRKENRKIFV